MPKYQQHPAIDQFLANHFKDESAFATYVKNNKRFFRSRVSKGAPIVTYEVVESHLNGVDEVAKGKLPFRVQLVQGRNIYAKYLAPGNKVKTVRRTAQGTTTDEHPRPPTVSEERAPAISNAKEARDAFVRICRELHEGRQMTYSEFRREVILEIALDCALSFHRAASGYTAAKKHFERLYPGAIANLEALPGYRRPHNRS